jgi:hypothetical protein
MASKDYQIKLLLTAINNASPVVKQMIKDMNHLEKIEKKQRLSKKEYEKWWENTLNKKTKIVAEHNAKLKKANQEQDKINSDRRKKEVDYTSFWGKELDKRDAASKKAAKEKEKIKKQEEQVVIDKRKKEVDYTSFWGKELDKRDAASKKAVKEEETRIKNLERQKRQQERNERRVRLQRYTDLSHAQESARAAMLYVSTPAAANAAFAIRNAMTMEQMGIRMRTQFGKEEGNMAFQEMKEYAAQTAFKLQEAVQLLSGMKVGQKGLGITNTKDLVSKSKSIGNVLLAFASSPEGRSEIAYQLSQVAMKRKANMRQDLMVMANYGLPIFEILEQQTGKTLEQLKDIYGAELPSDLIFKALDSLSKSPKVLQAMKERTDSLSQSWDTFGERVFFTSSAYGELLDKQLGIKDAINSTSTVLQKLEEQMRGVSKESLNTKEQVIGYTTAMVIGIPALTFTLLTFKKLFSVAAQTAGSTAALYRNMSLAGLVISGAYLTTVDWKEVIKDIDKEGFKGLLKHMDLLIIAAQTFATIMMFAIPGVFFKKGSGAIGSFLQRSTLTRAGIYGLAGYAAFKTGEELMDFAKNFVEQKRNEFAIEEYEKSMPKLQSSPGSESLFKAAKYGSSEMTPISNNQPINLIVENNMSMENGKLTGVTKVKRSAYDNPLISEVWQK